jgi:hypothetical protein
VNFKKLIWVSIGTAALLLLAACRPTDSTDEIAAPTPSAQGNDGIYQTLTIDAFANILANNRDDYTIINSTFPTRARSKAQMPTSLMTTSKR